MKIAIVSCYGEGEANSEYTKALENEFIALEHEVEILRLPFSVFGASSKSAKKQADCLIAEYAERLREFDFVNIHYEFLLYGRKTTDVLNRVLALINGCKDNRFSVVFHNFPEEKILTPLKLKLRHWKKKDTPSTVVQTLFHSVAKKNGITIVHTFRHQRYIKACCPKLHTIVMPLRYQRNEDIETESTLFSKADFMAENGISLPENTKIISIIGTLHPYKDYVSVIKALCCLPNNYHLFIFGGMHKLAFSDSSAGLPWINKAQRLTQQFGLTNRVHFMGYQETTKDFLDSCRFSDYIIMPYMEISESASASAYTALENCKHVFCTRNNCFDELSSFFNILNSGGGGGYFQYDMGNWLELAEKIKSLPHEQRVLKNRELFLKHYSITENAKKCIGQ